MTNMKNDNVADGSSWKGGKKFHILVDKHKMADLTAKRPWTTLSLGDSQNSTALLAGEVVETVSMFSYIR